MAMTCAKCGSAIERTPGPGRPPSYCSDLCKRLVEYEVRRIDRRLSGYEIELRGLKYDGPDWDEEAEGERQKRMRALRRWIQGDEVRLRELLGAGRNNQAAPGVESK